MLRSGLDAGDLTRAWTVMVPSVDSPLAFNSEARSVGAARTAEAKKPRETREAVGSMRREKKEMRARVRVRRGQRKASFYMHTAKDRRSD